jgi:hypothetical protein
MFEHGLNTWGSEKWNDLTNPKEINIEASKKLLYRIEEGNLIVPIIEEYILDYNRVAFLSASTVSSQKVGDMHISKSFKTLEEAVEFIKNDEEYIVNYITKKDYEMSWIDNLIYKSSFSFYEISDEKLKPFFDQKVQLEKRTIIKSEEIKEIIESSEIYEKCMEEFKAQEDQRKKLFEEAEKERTATIRRNNYEMWKILESKRAAGEFDEFTY